MADPEVTPAAEGDNGSDGFPTLASTQSDEKLTTDEIAAKPEVQEAFARVFGSEARPGRSTRQARQQATAVADELDGIEGASEDDGLEPEEDADGDGSQTKQDQQPTRAVEAAEPAPTLPANLRHAARRAGWTEDEIKEFATSSPDLAERTFQRLLTQFNDLSAQYATLGRTQPQGQLPPQAPQPRPAQQKPAAGAEDDLMTQLYGDPSRVEQLKEKYGDDLVSDLIGPLLKPVRDALNLVQEQEMQRIGTDVRGFFKDVEADFKEFYGQEGSLSDDQRVLRDRLGVEADAIRMGAARQGIELSVRDALERAHMMISAEHVAELERKRIKSQVQKRSKAITQKPSYRGPAGSGAPSDQNAMQAYTDRARELGYSLG